MLVTDVRRELESIMRSEGSGVSDVSRRIGQSRQCIYSAMKNKNFVPDSLVRIAESLGYDIEINFIKK